MSQATARLNLDNSPWNRGLREAQNALGQFEGGLKEIGGELAGIGSAAGLIGLAKHAAEVGSHFYDLSKRTGMSTESIQRLSYVADRTGTSVDSLAKAVLKMERQSAVLARSLKTAEEEISVVGEDGEIAVVSTGKLSAAFATLGIDAEKFTNLKPEDQLMALQKAMSSAGNDGQALDAIFTILGKGAGELLPLLRMSSEELEAMFKKAPVMADETIAKMKELQSAIEDIKHAGVEVGASVGNFLVSAAKEGQMVLRSLVGEAEWVWNRLAKGKKFADQQFNQGIEGVAEELFPSEFKGSLELKKKPITPVTDPAKEQKRTEALEKEIEKLDERLHKIVTPDTARLKELKDEIRAINDEELNAAELGKSAPSLETQKRRKELMVEAAELEKKLNEEQAREAKRLADETAREAERKADNEMRHAEKLASLKAGIAETEARNGFARLDAEQQLVVLEENRRRLLADAARLGGKNTEEGLTLLKEAATVEGQIAQAKDCQRQQDEQARRAAGNYRADSYAQSGFFAASRGDAIASLNARQNLADARTHSPANLTAVRKAEATAEASRVTQLETARKNREAQEARHTAALTKAGVIATPAAAGKPGASTPTILSTPSAVGLNGVNAVNAGTALANPLTPQDGGGVSQWMQQTAANTKALVDLVRAGITIAKMPAVEAVAG